MAQINGDPRQNPAYRPSLSLAFLDMEVYQNLWKEGEWQAPLEGNPNAQLLLAFFSPSCMHKKNIEKLQEAFPRALLAGCSTAGEIHGQKIHDQSISLTALQFQKSHIESAFIQLDDYPNSFLAGRALAKKLPVEGLRHVLLLAEGIVINGSELVRGVRDALPAHVAATGGLAADGEHFQKTELLWQDCCHTKAVGAIGFYGKDLQLGYGSMGGWDPFGPFREITRSENNILYELDGKPALSLYKKYLGKFASELPASALLFPLQLESKEAKGLVRTILGIDETKNSLIFAGDMPAGTKVRLMKANFHRLIDGAESAANHSLQKLNAKAQIALLISCVGRRMVLKQRSEEELEAVASIFGGQTFLCGFYSYGEISPLQTTAQTTGGQCELHNQTMTITSMSE